MNSHRLFPLPSGIEPDTSVPTGSRDTNVSEADPVLDVCRSTLGKRRPLATTEDEPIVDKSNNNQRK